MKTETLTQTPCARCGKPCPAPAVLNISRRSAPSALAAAAPYCTRTCANADAIRELARAVRCDECGRSVDRDELVDAKFCTTDCRDRRADNVARAWKLVKAGRPKLGRTEAEIEESYRLLGLIAPEIGRDEHALRGRVLKLMELCARRHEDAVSSRRREEAHVSEQRRLDRDNARGEQWTKKNETELDASLAKHTKED